MDFTRNKRTFLSREALQDRVIQLGKQITADYSGCELILVGVLKGSLYFMADLSREIDLPIQIDFMSIGVYPNSNSQTGVVRITKDLDFDIEGRDVLVIEDIIRSGLTTGYLLQNLEMRKPKSLRVCSLLLNPEQQLINFPVHYIGFNISKTWLIGYGMDAEERGRNLPYIAEM